jgi:hypothetical protein
MDKHLERTNISEKTYKKEMEGFLELPLFKLPLESERNERSDRSERSERRNNGLAVSLPSDGLLHSLCYDVEVPNNLQLSKSDSTIRHTKSNQIDTIIQ